ncbi:MAG TPA: serine/threonine-protein kinase [Polyangiales bacterium]|nr:serine/threonine-protein kinase [Polyangiales bacterium]
MANGDANREVLPTCIGERYRVEQLLGTGGMASVYQVHDLASGRKLALKRLNTGKAASSQSDDALLSQAEITQDAPLGAAAAVHAGQLFEREFDTLSQLVHPHIIEVYDYRRDAHGPYYTMELLDGGDLRQRSPLPWREACKLLCDVCSAISLLHSRRLVHRDLTPLNIRCTRAGSAKLFDFGSMTPFGRSRHVVGTPPFVAPEALHGEVVDAQTDLFSLGATAYYALTGRHAYPARQLLALPDAWRHAPDPPSVHAPEIPRALDELVLWLLQLAPSARPPSAAEVMERLSAIAGFDLQEALVVRQAYLSTPMLAGRQQQLERVRKRLRSASEAQGGTLVVSGPRGAGRTRLLDACVLEARLLGAIVLRADESEASARWGVASALLRQLLAQTPELALPAMHERAADLVHLLPEVAGSQASGAREPAAELRSRAALQRALRDLMLDVAEQQLTLVVVDDVQRIDEPSAALLALIAHDCRRRRLLLIASVERSDHAAAAKTGSGLSWLLQAGEPLRLPPLSAEESAQLVCSLFGDVPNVRLLADRIHSASGGNPAAIMHIARQLVAAGRARYAAGTWTLPSLVEVAELSLELHAGVERSLHSGALELARALAACEGQRLQYRECLMLSSHGDPRRLIGELDELVASGIVSVHAQRYFVSGEGLRAALLRGLEPLRARELHARLAELHACRPESAFREAHHRWQAGQSARALDILLADLRLRSEVRAREPAVLFEYVQSLPLGWQATFRALIQACDVLDRPRRDRLDLQLAFLALATVTAGYEPACLRSVAAQLRFDSGLDIYETLDPSLPQRERLSQAVAAAEQRFEQAPVADRGMAPAEAMRVFSQVMTEAVGMAGRALDHDLLESLPSLAPLAPLSAALSIAQRNVENTRDLLAGRVLRGLRGSRRLIAQLGEPGVFRAGEGNARLMTLALNWSTAIIEANVGDPTALTRADIIETSPLFVVNAWRVRGLFALFQGDVQGAEHCRVQTELLQIQNSPPQLFEGSHSWQMALGHFAARDLLRTKQCIADLEAMARQFEHWKPALYFARGAYQMLRGDAQRALTEFERALAAATLGRHVAWPACAGGVLSGLNAQERWAESSQRGYAMLEDMKRVDVIDQAFFVVLPLAEAELERGEYARSSELLRLVIDALDGPGRRCVYLARARELQARLAVRMRDEAAWHRAFAHCEEQYLPSKNAQLRINLNQLQRTAREAGLLPHQPLEQRAELDVEGAGSMVATVLSSCEQTQERVERALLLLTRHSRCNGGFLYTLRSEGPLLVAQRGGREPLPQLDTLVKRYVVEQVGPRDRTRSQCLTTTTEPSVPWHAADGTLFVPMLLAHRSVQGTCITGVAVMWLRPDSHYRVPTRLLTALSRTLHESGDTLTVMDKAHWIATEPRA